MKQFVLSSICVIIVTFTGFGQRSYKELMLDNSVNFYEVCAAADAYFEIHDKNIKGSGYMGYQRWKYANEGHYYPTGDRSNIDPAFVRKQYELFLSENSTSTEKALFEDGWSEVGPVTIDSISGHYSAGLGRIETFYVDPLDEDRIYLGSRSGGFWRTTDGGETWDGGSTDFLPACGVNTLTVSPTNPDSVLINIRNGGNGTTHGVYRSIDGGYNWTETNYNPTILDKGGLGSNFAVNQIKYHPTVPNLILIAANDGLYRSDDNLETWLKVTNGSISEIEFHPTDPSIIYIYDYYYWGPNKNKVLRSTDFGLSFVGSADIAGNADNTNVHFDVSPLCENCLYFASSNGLWKSFDSGLTFSFVSNPAVSSEGFAVSDLDTTKITFGGIDGFASADGGVTFDQTTWWSLGSAEHGPGTFQERYQSSNNYFHADIRYTEAINGVFYMATDGLLARSYDNGLTWEVLTDEMGIRENYTLGVGQSNHYRTVVGSQDNGTSIKHKDGWLEYWGADGMEGIIHPLNSDWIIGSNQFGGRRRTYDGGLTQGAANPPGHSSSWVAPLVYDPNNQQTIYHFGELIHKSEDFGTTWEDIGDPSLGGQILEAAVAENNTEIMVVARYNQIKRSIDGGVSFTNISSGLPVSTITDIAFDPKRDSTFIVTYDRYNDDGQKVYITHDLGNTWTNITANLNSMPVNGAVIDHSDASNIYLATEIGVYVKAMDEPLWELYNDNLPNTTMEELEIVYGSNTIRGASWGRGVYEYALKDRLNYPAIVMTSITDMPTYVVPAEESEQYVTSLISYEWEILETYVKWSINEPTFENTILMENVSDSTWVSVSPIPDFPAGTKVYFKVYSKGIYDDLSETYKFMYTVQPYEYCESFGNMSWTTAVTLVDFSELNNATGKEAPYTSYILTDTATVYQTMDYDLTINMDTDGPYSIYAKAWIDWNRNGSFEDDGEEYELGTAYDTEDGPSTLSPLSITVPIDAHLGKTTMRVAAKYSAYATPCETGFDGEVEDYTIFIKEPIEIDFEIGPDNICFGESVSFEYTGTPLDAISWSFTNGVVTYTSDEMSDEITFDSPGTYNLTLIGYEGELSDGGVWAGVINVHPTFTLETDTLICEGEELIFGSQTLSNEGVYTEPFSTVYGCDSIVTLTLSFFEADVAVTVTDYTLYANETDATYQWLDCNADWAEIDGATMPLFEPAENGSYAVIVTNEDCADTSACYDIISLTVEEQQNEVFKIYPNPNNGLVFIDFMQGPGRYELFIHDMSGKLIEQKNYENIQSVQLNLNVAPGMYTFTILNEAQLETVLKIAIE